MNPLGMLSVLLSHDGLSRRMGRIYQRYLYRGTVDALRVQDPNLPKGSAIGRWLWPGWIPLRSVRFRPGGEEIKVGIDSYNDEALKRNGGPGTAIPNFIVNSTALNSGAPFRFSSVEIGDPRLGYFRYDEIDLLKSRKNLIERPVSELLAMLNGNARPQFNNEPLPVALALWWLTRDTQPIKPPQYNEWKHLFGNPAAANVIDSMCKTNFGRLRQLKLPAWYIRKGLERHPPVTGGVSDPQHHLARFNSVLREVEPKVAPEITSAIANQDPLGKEVLDFAIELYYLRSAEVMSPRLRADFDRISLGTAVAASANFPPVFPPLVLLGIYDDLHVTRLGLSDGGVYDNVGIATLVDEGCTHIIASDTGAPFEVKQRVTSGYFGMILRLPAVLTDDVAEQQRSELRERERVSAGLASYHGGNPTLLDLKDAYGLKGLAFFSIDSLAPTGGGGGIHLGRLDREAVACLRTDLDSFGDLEVAALVNAGCDRADRFLRAYFTAPPYTAANNPAWSSSANAPHTISAADAARMPRVLAVGRSRLFRALWLGSWPAWLFTLASIAVLLYLLGNREVLVPALLDRVTGALLRRLEAPLPFFPDLWINKCARALVKTPRPLWQLLLVAALVILVVFEVWPRLVSRLRLTRAAKSRKLVWAMKWVRAFAPALLLFFGLAPVWIALAAFVVAEVSYWAYNKPFLWATRIR